MSDISDLLHEQAASAKQNFEHALQLYGELYPEGSKDLYTPLAEAIMMDVFAAGVRYQTILEVQNTFSGTQSYESIENSAKLSSVKKAVALYMKSSFQPRDS
jgi:hypothetical protein